MTLFERIKKACPELTGRFSPTLDLYILRIFLGVYVVNLLCFCLVYGLTDHVHYVHNLNLQESSLCQFFNLLFHLYTPNLTLILSSVPSHVFNRQHGLVACF